MDFSYAEAFGEIRRTATRGCCSTRCWATRLCLLTATAWRPPGRCSRRSSICGRNQAEGFPQLRQRHLGTEIRRRIACARWTAWHKADLENRVAWRRRSKSNTCIRWAGRGKRARREYFLKTAQQACGRARARRGSPSPAATLQSGRLRSWPTRSSTISRAIPWEKLGAVLGR